jgi:hypothetical protein
MVMVYGEDCIMIHTLVNGDTLKLKDMEFIHGRMEIDMKENGKYA